MKHTGREKQGADEHGTLFKQGAVSMAVGYPASYRVGASSLGAQFVYKALNQVRDLACGRFYLEDDNASPPIVLESGRPVSDMQAVAFSISCEQELLGIIRLLRRAGFEPFAADRHDADPPIIIGGPLTTLDPRLVAPLADIVVIGAADHLVIPLGEALVAPGRNKAARVEAMAAVSPAMWAPHLTGTPPPDLDAPLPKRPASAATWSQNAELADLFLVEATRGCKRRCAFCTMSRDANLSPCFHAFEIDDILAEIPEKAPGVGLVGAAVTDHPLIETLVQSISAMGKRVSLSSIRADRLTENLALLLHQSGLRTLTVAADGASEAVRKSIKKGITAKHLTSAVEIARAAKFSGLKVYSMLGLPEETDDDVREFAALLLDMAARIKVSATVQAFVPKPGTPLAETLMAPIPVIEQRLALLRKITAGRVRLLPTSPKWSFIDWKLAHGAEASARAAEAAEKDGGSFAAWRNAVARYIP